MTKVKIKGIECETNSTENYSRPTQVHIMKTNIGFSYDNPPNRVKEALVKTCLSTPGILHDPEPEVKTNEYGESKIIYEVEFAIANFKEHEEIMDDFMSRTWYTARRYNLNMPLPQLTVHQAHELSSPQEKKTEHLEASLQKLPKMLPIEKINVNELLDGTSIQHYGKGEKIIKEGDKTGSLFVIKKGTALITATTEDNLPHQIGELGKGDFFGEITLFTTKFSSFTVTASEDLEVIAIHPDEVLQMVELNPRLARYLDEMMDARRLKLKKVKANEEEMR